MVTRPSIRSIEDATHAFVLGSAKCGSTSPCSHLDQYSDICFSEPKEPVFFEAEYERGLDYYHRRYFEPWSGEPIVAERRTHNLMLPFVPERIRVSLLDAKLVVILRDPVYRAYSHWWHRYSRRLESDELRTACRANLACIRAGITYAGECGTAEWPDNLRLDQKNAASRSVVYLWLRHYAEQIERYLASFPRERLEILFFEDLEFDPAAVARRVWTFLGLDPNAELAELGARNVANPYRTSPFAVRLRRVPVPTFARRSVPRPVARAARAFLRGRPVERPPLDTAAEKWLADYYEPHHRSLEHLLGREITGWRRGRRSV